MKLRHEYKIFLNYSDYLTVRSRLRAVIPHDNHVDETGEYKIRSLYFDNMYNKALYEKISGVSIREKFRIRCYNDNYDFIKLEKKSKINGMCSKVSETVTKEEVRRIIQGDTEWMLNSDRQLVSELYTKMKTEQLRPKVIVDYNREPFVYSAGNVRITLDRNVRTSINSVDMLNPNVPTVLAEGQTIILEVKYDNYKPTMISDIVMVQDRLVSSFSKYVACRKFG
ncbi:VTC domain protein [Ruminiclostridium papyrosolvens DSM 2782]|uniref:VTC domain protein n=1 Tax=Ruminiclostridium papyrosolvens DSM 2782 TaxID=588581 RepID=F1T8Z9_9FIRM|nr:polyphosphate polymerase domain-containing protein [Ruminiclostridium papyrosolvens]EGD48981.1 VTC domain protein [Ruminiclostridium papyrosolvens DSM 2782]WES35465.1 polyphosphate polymerase domain-containing protein [Ruminiclostridium papyrosolvens DSM 2782]